jgi:hypothetical protein
MSEQNQTTMTTEERFSKAAEATIKMTLANELLKQALELQKELGWI